MAEQVAYGDLRSWPLVKLSSIVAIAGEDLFTAKLGHPALGRIVQGYVALLKHLQGTAVKDIRVRQNRTRAQQNVGLQHSHKLRATEHRKWCCGSHIAFWRFCGISEIGSLPPSARPQDTVFRRNDSSDSWQRAWRGSESLAEDAIESFGVDCLVTGRHPTIT